LERFRKNRMKIKISQTKFYTYLILGYCVILLWTFSYMYDTLIHNCTFDSRFCKIKSLLKCDDGYVFNATLGDPNPAHPDYYFCSPYKEKPAFIFYYRDNMTIEDVFHTKSEVSIFKVVCPFEDKDVKYQLFVGDWHRMKEECEVYKRSAYMYSTYAGYKSFCCLPQNYNETKIYMSRLFIYT
jgi:hypothetical protein